MVCCLTLTLRKQAGRAGQTACEATGLHKCSLATVQMEIVSGLYTSHQHESPVSCCWLRLCWRPSCAGCVPASRDTASCRSKAHMTASVQVDILCSLCTDLLDLNTIKAEIDRREQRGQFVAGKGGIGGANPVRTDAQRVKRMAPRQQVCSLWTSLLAILLGWTGAWLLAQRCRGSPLLCQPGHGRLSIAMHAQGYLCICQLGHGCRTIAMHAQGYLPSLPAGWLLLTSAASRPCRLPLNSTAKCPCRLAMAQSWGWMSLRMMATWTCVCSAGLVAAWCAATGAQGLSICAALARRPRACQTESGCALSAAWAVEVSCAVEPAAAANAASLPAHGCFSHMVCCSGSLACSSASRHKE